MSHVKESFIIEKKLWHYERHSIMFLKHIHCSGLKMHQLCSSSLFQMAGISTPNDGLCHVDPETNELVGSDNWVRKELTKNSISVKETYFLQIRSPTLRLELVFLFYFLLTGRGIFQTNIWTICHMTQISRFAFFYRILNMLIVRGQLSTSIVHIMFKVWDFALSLIRAVLVQIISDIFH